jgi:4'-phosphopantetheinyl transferase
VDPADWRFTPPPGKPRVAHPPLTRPLHFNLAHTPGLVACVVSATHERIGVDVERVDRDVETLSGEGQGRAFLADWTLKESYAKARGLGLELPLDGIVFRFDDAGDIRVALAAGLDDDPAPWRFALLETPTRHLVAVAADTGGAALSLRANAVAL